MIIITHSLKPMVVGIAQKQLNQRWPHEGKFGPPLFFNALIISPFICLTSELPAVHFLCLQDIVFLPWDLCSVRPLLFHFTFQLCNIICFFKTPAPHKISYNRGLEFERYRQRGFLSSMSQNWYLKMNKMWLFFYCLLCLWRAVVRCWQ